MRENIDFNEVYTEFYPKIIRYVSRIVDPNDAEDITQDVFNKVNFGLGGFQGKSKISTWIYRIATNTAIDRLRSATYKYETRQNTIEDATDPEAKSVCGSHESSASDQAVIRREMSECVQEYVDNLPPDYKNIITLSELDDLTNKEIADILGISLENVKIRLHRARSKLKTTLNDACVFYHNEQNVLACDRKPSQILTKMPE